MAFNVILPPAFKKTCNRYGKKHRSLKELTLTRSIGSLEQNPLQGEPLGKDCYKVAWPLPSKEKAKVAALGVIPALRWLDQNVYLALHLRINRKKKNISDK